MQKLDGVYKTVQTLSTDSSEMKEKNRNLRKENNFYKKQIADLRKLHSRFEKRYFAGEFWWLLLDLIDVKVFKIIFIWSSIFISHPHCSIVHLHQIIVLVLECLVVRFLCNSWGMSCVFPHHWLRICQERWVICFCTVSLLHCFTKKEEKLVILVN